MNSLGKKKVELGKVAKENLLTEKKLLWNAAKKINWTSSPKNDEDNTDWPQQSDFHDVRLQNNK